MKVAEIVAGCLLTAAGVLSLIKWVRRPFVPGSASEHALYLLHLTARIGVWFAFAALFFGFAFVDDTEAFRWFILVPIALAGVQLLTAVALARSPTGVRPNLVRRARDPVVGRGRLDTARGHAARW